MLLAILTLKSGQFSRSSLVQGTSSSFAHLLIRKNLVNHFKIYLQSSVYVCIEGQMRKWFSSVVAI